MDIPDPWFLAHLLEAGLDLDGDGAVSVSEAGRIKVLDLPPSGISSLEGIAAFSALESLSIRLNSLDSLDLRANTSLRYLDIYSCELRLLELGSLPELAYLGLNRNSLLEIELSGCTQLREFYCTNNQFTHIDVAGLPELKGFRCCGNFLDSLDVSLNPKLELLGIDNMSMLIKVCVWALPFPPEGVRVIMGYSPNVSFTMDCP